MNSYPKIWVTDLKNLEKVWISRCFKPKNFGKILSVELYHFADANSKGYGYCTYIRSGSEIHTRTIIEVLSPPFIEQESDEVLPLLYNLPCTEGSVVKG